MTSTMADEEKVEAPASEVKIGSFTTFDGEVVRRFGEPIAEVFWSKLESGFIIRLKKDGSTHSAGRHLAPAVAKAVDLHQARF
jgi:hypothetical protein